MKIAPLPLLTKRKRKSLPQEKSVFSFLLFLPPILPPPLPPPHLYLVNLTIIYNISKSGLC